MDEQRRKERRGAMPKARIMDGVVRQETDPASVPDVLPVPEAQPVVGVGSYEPTAVFAEEFREGVTGERLMEFQRELNKYKAGKASLDRRVQAAERWWKMRNQIEEDSKTDGSKDKFRTVSAWLHNVINSKHADALEAYPSPNILPREEDDKLDAWALKHIVPVILEQNDFESTFDLNMWQKLKTGTGVYEIVWDKGKLNGLGDVSVIRVDLLNLFWEPGVTDIQKSKYFFHTEWMDIDDLVDQYPELKDKHLASTMTPVKMPTDDTVPTDNKVVVVDCYYRRHGKLHYCKYIGDNVLYATENDPERAEKGLYDHGLYPFVFDCLFPVEGSPAGYGYVDICANPQTRIDLMNQAMLKNSVVGATPRYFERIEGAVNEEEFLDLNNPIIHVSGNLGEDSLRLVDYKPLSGNYITFLNNVINELRETSSNTETSTGSSSHGVTAASALAALQEASGKTSRASTLTTYRAYKKVVYMVIELIRQFYTMPRQFRITGRMGVQRFIQFSNMGMQPQHQGVLGDVDLGYRVPVYDIYVEPEKRTSYTRLAQNELALQLYSAGAFNPQMADQALMLLNMMDFDGKDELMQKLAQNGTMFDQLQLMQAMAATLAAKYEPTMLPGILQGAGINAGGRMPAGSETGREASGQDIGEAKHVSRARERAATVAQPGGSTA